MEDRRREREIEGGTLNEKIKEKRDREIDRESEVYGGVDGRKGET